MYDYEMMGWVDKVVPILFLLLMGVVLIVILTILVRGFLRLHEESRSLQVTVNAAVTAKRTDRSYDHSWTDANGRDGKYHAHTVYYATFQMENGEREEFELAGSEYGLLARGDVGELDYKGSRFLGFQRFFGGSEESQGQPEADKPSEEPITADPAEKKPAEGGPEEETSSPKAPVAGV